jgi:chromosome segregation ATPase
MGTLTKIEEKAFRKYVDSFMADAANIENPMKRLDECIDILNCFEEGNCPDLRESLEKTIIDEKKKLESLVESVVSTQKDLGMDVNKLKENAMRNTAQGLMLADQVTDYQQLCEGLSKRNKVLREDNTKLKARIKKLEEQSNKKIEGANKTIVNNTKENKGLKENLVREQKKNSALMERISKLALSNKHFEKENGILSTKLKEAGQLVVKGKRIRESKNNDLQTLINEKNKMLKVIKQQKEQMIALKEQYDAQSIRFDRLHEKFENYKQEEQDTFNPVQHIMPSAEQRIGKYLNLKENGGVEIENYWADLKSKYKEAIDPYE